ncbi:MAG TPA: thiamine pyrophosphate-dependent enzyme [Candidatus Limnocylindria bacterium]|nr:thiamine pyrophosphate-dependent enzyme [Candidatus Limnocylindria bacterium]
MALVPWCPEWHIKSGSRAAVSSQPRLSPAEIVSDYRLAFRSRVASVSGRREVLTGKAPFGIFGDGKEVAQLALARAFRPGDWRSGYYRDQTVMFATGMSDLAEFFAQLYTNTDIEADPASAGRQMVSHFATRTLEADGRWKRLADAVQSAADLSPVAAHMPRSLGLAYASKLYRADPALRAAAPGFSASGDEITFATIGNAGTSEGLFWETMNAAGVLQVPLLVSVWDDGYGISVPNELQTTKSSISAALAGFQRGPGTAGFEIRVVKGWDYPGLVDTYAEIAGLVRSEQIPALIHVTEMTQPQGHSTSGSHERYKTTERLAFETSGDPITKMREWMIADKVSSAAELDAFEDEDRKTVESARVAAHEAYQAPIKAELDRARGLIERAQQESPDVRLAEVVAELADPLEISRRAVQSAVRRAVYSLRGREGAASGALRAFAKGYAERNAERYGAFLYSRSADSPLKVTPIAAEYSDRSETIDGRLVLLRNFDLAFARDPRLFVLGEDVGRLGDVNLVFEGLQAKYGDRRFTDTGIREATILGQGIGAALRGLRPIVDIQYVDYLLYALELASDDLAPLHYRTAGGQKAPVIIRTKGHRLQGIWHTGSPMSVVLNALRGVYVAVPRNMVQAAGFYNTFFRGDNPALVVEVLNGYRLKERVPDNLGDFRLPLGVPETVRAGGDLTIVTYGALVRIAIEAAAILSELGIDAEIIDVQTLNPFDLRGAIAESLKKTNALLVVDEDVPGGASAYILREALEAQGGFQHLDAAPRTLTAAEHRAPVGVDGDYFAKPNREQIVEAAYAIMRERRPRDLPDLRL